MSHALVIGAGPAGLMAAEEMARAGMQVTVAEGKPSAGRKFLMAGKSGLNLTKDEPLDNVLSAYDAPQVLPMVRDFGPDQVQAWARGLGQELFVGSSGRVFPTVMKASPLLRAWMARLQGLGVTLRTRWRWTGWDGDTVMFDTPQGQQGLIPDATVLALGGGSWARLGADGSWVDVLRDAGVRVAPFKPANMGFVIDWTAPMAKHFGTPVKGCALIAAGQYVRGEFVISHRGVEGGGVYAVSRAVRDGAPLAVDLLPDWSVDKVRHALDKPRGKASLSNHLRKVLRLDPARLALLMEFGRPLPAGPGLATLVKHLPIRHAGPRPLDEAISTAGGVSWASLDETLMLTARPGTWCAGEMLNWEAPTGGYLLTGCLATGRWAGRAAAQAARARA